MVDVIEPSDLPDPESPDTLNCTTIIIHFVMLLIKLTSRDIEYYSMVSYVLEKHIEVSLSIL